MPVGYISLVSGMEDRRRKTETWVMLNINPFITSWNVLLVKKRIYI